MIRLKKLFLVLLAVAVLLTATAALWQFVPLFGISWEDIENRMEFASYHAEPLDTNLEGFRVPSSISFGGNFNPGLRICMGIQNTANTGYDDHITFTLNTEFGAWYNYSGMYDPNDPPPYENLPEYTKDSLTVPNGGTIWWVDSYCDPDTGEYISYMDVDYDINFIDIIIYEDTHIIGYAVYKQSPGYSGEEKLHGIYVAERVGGSFFPKIDGEYQNIRQECIEVRIEEIKENTRNMPVSPVINQIKSG